ncbi:secreted RxLR effector peptide protein (Avh9.1), putative [Phytophthora infestans T30-4]|uniref:RxLR effector protein n=1 Tax=Phytophthora infestans (strain T30-4) TaxID=403677 RepID=D0N609_PHYIT|nr:secreted RxLR effector peptide protein (Avh9.1), putative [Phytophthora infestans T30-4]EEY70500.1 secreted RxLR effector peptide protein (Avh9.1), putative [Phytophthora infestans T30-4]|eukprot:XP_002998154.1 secreted RxLR effector peptide protein (Avh9.1), putative [Phytophthora infestans T30-4]
MRLYSILSASMVISYFVTCNAATSSDQTKLSRMEPSLLVHSLGAALNVDAIDRRFLRERKESMEERGYHLTLKGEVKALAKKIIADFNTADDVYKKWNENGHSLNKIANLLKVSEKEKYAPVYNGYLAYLNRINS